ncbi:helix-turn-helix transcriptional regulator [Actinosynnema sp. NPDC047251]|uniref:Transcriptional regulator, XRE family n=1 Tax=Saccharothrix espanaensis (strain ATCC 51144 / DSM 44229 / JCM 9112 / NBRC 15066 / NRRL 15764) TaxID=1179773 RepID=K0JRV8_SACES|nr:helix-turn-helix transcriptional regulator [Saccharothrix espanaensis]CCH28531.1 Transcriptional regulator, XRE family [Saccharothrix espanaensis DSM 44229]
MQIDTAAYQRVLGDELRSLRKQRGWTRKELNRRLQSEISLQTLATYELGTRQCSVVRLVEICVALGVPAHQVLARVHDRVFGDAPAGHLSVDLAAVVADTRPQLLPLRRWAQGRLNQLTPGQAAEVHLDLPALEYMAQLCRLSTVDLIRILRELDKNRPG